jgi:hypothetical protein
MKNKFWLKTIFISVCLIFLSLSQVHAASLGDAFNKSALNDVAGNNYNTDTTLNETIGIIIQSLLGFLGVIFMGLIIYAGMLWMTAEGDEAKVEKAQKIMRNAIIGLIITVSAYAISFFVINAISAKTLTQDSPVAFNYK